MPPGTAVSTAQQLGSFLQDEEEIYLKGNKDVQPEFAGILSGGKLETEGGVWVGVSECPSSFAAH
jgi:hypothetical protein